MSWSTGRPRPHRVPDQRPDRTGHNADRPTASGVDRRDSSNSLDHTLDHTQWPPGATEERREQSNTPVGAIERAGGSHRGSDHPDHLVGPAVGGSARDRFKKLFWTPADPRTLLSA